MRIIFQRFRINSKLKSITRQNGCFVQSLDLHREYSSTDASDVVARNSLPDYIKVRSSIWNELQLKHAANVKAKENSPIKITLPDNQVQEAVSWQTSPYDIVKRISQKLASETIVARVNDTLWDLSRPLETDCTLQFLTFNDDAAQEVYWNSSAHMLGAVMELLYAGLLCAETASENGFYADMYNKEQGVCHDFFFSFHLIKYTNRYLFNNRFHQRTIRR